jgi:hypothetical protein
MRRASAHAPDIAVIGSGVSATLLAQSLVRRGCFRTLRIIDRPRGLQAHRLAYWSDCPTPFDEYVDASWPALAIVDAEGRRLELPLSRLPYKTFPTRRWHADAHQRLREAPGVEFVDARARSIEPREHDVIVHAGGTRHRADWCFTSAAFGRAQPDAWQRFEGWEVVAAGGDTPELTPTWMDFRTPASGDFRFMYALPLAPGRLLVEHVSYRPASHGARIRDYLNGVLGMRGWEVVDREAGATPLYAVPPARRMGRVVQLGVAAGLAKACTGYALTRMWRDAEALAEGLAGRGRPPEMRAPRSLYYLGDRLFLDLLRRSPERLPEFLHALGRGSTGDALLAFLDDRASLRERLEVARAAPGWVRWWLAKPGIPPHGRADIARRP